MGGRNEKESKRSSSQGLKAEGLGSKNVAQKSERYRSQGPRRSVALSYAGWPVSV